MNTNAFEILDEFNLPHPRVYDIANYRQIENESVLFVRYCEGLKCNNHVVSATRFKKNIEKYIKEYEDNILVQVADVITGSGGFAVYLYEQYIYGEYVDGEIVSLLRGGYCQRRFLINRINGEIYVMLEEQRVICNIVDYQYVWSDYNSKISDKEFLEKILKLKTYLLDIKDAKNLLIEGHFVENSILFSDAVYRPLKIDFQSLFCGNKEIVLRRSANEGQRVVVDRLNIDIDPKVDIVCVRKGALLSHYITYYINDITVIFKI